MQVFPYILSCNSVVIVQVVPNILRCVTVSLCKWFLTFWEVPMCYCGSGSCHFEKCQSVTVKMVPHILRCDTVSLCKWFLTFWDVILCTVQVVPDILRCVTVSLCKSDFWHLERWQASLSGSSTVWPWWWCQEPSKCQKPLSQWHSTTFQNTCTLMVTYLWAPYKMEKVLISWVTVSFSKGTAVLTV